ncbi:hypothetical protein QR98_0060030 [Sarcoptes scabiei]|uniref:Uncharacterized protein n=1 Tax=Sarcoptes scabiei TaxID=52283 RepID=A0A132A9D1_SARSC|nr:hypothetical protein QR98_0060030 [Sarcoptes scabiei]
MAKKGMDVRELRSKVDKLKQLQKQNNHWNNIIVKESTETRYVDVKLIAVRGILSSKCSIMAV